MQCGVLDSCGLGYSVDTGCGSFALAGRSGKRYLQSAQETGKKEPVPRVFEKDKQVLEVTCGELVLRGVLDIKCRWKC
jgi:hypothetical protein